MKLARKIAERLRKEEGLDWIDPARARIRRTYAGHHQRSEGAWSWELLDENGGFFKGQGIGSQWPATVVAKAERLEVSVSISGMWDIIPVNK